MTLAGEPEPRATLRSSRVDCVQRKINVSVSNPAVVKAGRSACVARREPVDYG